jgi:hypothetical protein
MWYLCNVMQGHTFYNCGPGQWSSFYKHRELLPKAEAKARKASSIFADTITLHKEEPPDAQEE